MPVRAAGSLIFRIVPIFLVGIFMLFKFFTAERIENPVTGRKHRVALSAEQEMVLGVQSYQQVLANSDVVTSGPEVDLVRRVASRLASAVGDDGKDFQWEVSVIRSPMANAFCLPGGKIAVYTGILRIAETEAGLATVMGHEMAHAIARHAGQRIFQHQMYQTAMMGVSLSMGDMDFEQRRALMGVLGAGAQFGVILPFSRNHETEADQMGLLYMARAGYDPRESVGFWQRMSEAGGNQPPEFASTHPSHGTRIENLKQFLPKAIEEYEKAGRRSF